VFNGISLSISPYSYNRSKPSNINFQKKLPIEKEKEILETWYKKNVFKGLPPELFQQLLQELPPELLQKLDPKLLLIKDALREVANCRGCKAPKCETVCHLGDTVSHPNTMKSIKKGNFLSAIAEFDRYPFVGSLCQLCDKICLREGGCGVNFNKIEKLIAEYKKKFGIKFLLDKNAVKDENESKAAVIGSGIAGLTAALDLTRLGYKVYVFESDNVIGGQLSRTIPASKFDRKRWLESIETLKQLGIKFIPNCKVGRKRYEIKDGKRINVGDRVSLKRLTEMFDLVFANNGACLQNLPDIKGIDLPNVFSAGKFLEKSVAGNKIEGLSNNIEENINKVVVISGGGDVAIDAALSATEMGCKNVKIIYRNGLADMSAHKEKIVKAKKEKIKFLPKHQIAELTQNNGKTTVKFTPDSATDSMDIDVCVFAHGSKPEPIKTENGTLPMNEKGRIDADPKTGKVRGYDNLFASGDNTVLGSEANAIYAVRKTKKVVEYAHELMSNRIPKQVLRKANRSRNRTCGKLNSTIREIDS